MRGQEAEEAQEVVASRLVLGHDLLRVPQQHDQHNRRNSLEWPNQPRLSQLLLAWEGAFSQG
ncbi:MAG: hypothetical protein H6Q53_67 [Deltaproteobacteria bacterium]|nr:hypothetical protein [Deltaproteobacteria bacterium]